jgi:hypothetical protein
MATLVGGCASGAIEGQQSKPVPSAEAPLNLSPQWPTSRNTPRTVDVLKAWALRVQGQTTHNKAIDALANKLARICYAVLGDHEPYGKLSVREKHKMMNRTEYAGVV